MWQNFIDYYTYINNEWLIDFNLPNDYSRFCTFDEVSVIIEQQIKNILNDCSENLLEQSSNNLLLKNLYFKLNQKEKIESLNKYIILIDKCNDLDDIFKIIGLFNILNINIFLNLPVEQDLKNNMKYILYLNQNSTVLPSKHYYTDSKYEKTCIKYKEFLKQILK